MRRSASARVRVIAQECVAEKWPDYGSPMMFHDMSNWLLTVAALACAYAGVRSMGTDHSDAGVAAALAFILIMFATIGSTRKRKTRRDR